MSELNTIVIEPRVVEVGGTSVEVKTIKVKQLTLVLQLIAPISERLVDFKQGNQSEVTPKIIKLLMSNSDLVIKVMSVLTDKDVEFFENLEVDELVKVFLVVLEVNSDFFIQKVLPLLEEGIQGMTQRLNSRD